jgi:hypothetical protein
MALSSKSRLYLVGAGAVGSAAARSGVWLHRSWSASGLQFWTPALISFALTAGMLALIFRMFMNAADEADPLTGWLKAQRTPDDITRP